MHRIRIANPIVRSLTEWLLTIVLAFLLFLILRNFLFRVAHVSGSSMEPTLMHNDMVLLSRLSYRLADPQAGDIVAFPFKENPSEFYIKRIIGVPGDVIGLDGLAFTVNGDLLDDLFSKEVITQRGDADFPFTVKDGTYFVLGDNRNNSKDSRFTSVGCIPKEDLVGKVTIRLWPFSAFGRVD